MTRARRELLRLERAGRAATRAIRREAIIRSVAQAMRTLTFASRDAAAIHDRTLARSIAQMRERALRG